MDNDLLAEPNVLDFDVTIEHDYDVPVIWLECPICRQEVGKPPRNDGIIWPTSLANLWSYSQIHLLSHPGTRR